MKGPSLSREHNNSKDICTKYVCAKFYKTNTIRYYRLTLT